MNGSNIQETAKLFFDSNEYYQSLFEDISKAQNEILLESYIFDLDRIGLNLLYLLEQAKKRGVSVFINIDMIGSWNALTPLKTWANRHKVSLSIYNANIFRLNKRNHRKLIVIDGHICYLGSLNITEKHLAWRDLGVRTIISHEEYELCKKHFLKARRGIFYFPWTNPQKILKRFKKRQKAIADKKQQRFFFNTTLLDRIALVRWISRECRKAQHQICLASPYFLPRSFLLWALVRAARRGVSVTVLIPAQSDVWFTQFAIKYYLSRFIKFNISIYEYLPKIWHAKALIIDNCLLIGSHNWNHRSFLHDLEILYCIQEQRTIQNFHTEWQKDLLVSKPILNGPERFPWWQKAIGYLIFLFRYWM
ncbi:MAG: phosphatidylserine/phosphatidylglycerophosphate/cardiolipin synthase family protein [Bdellovibrionaceae bacterium]|nr:phosphatidylserine/phosphatidylglycerophosphate/cardiolipin synthase family protein [Pseudobdellovibrionaceae bacterium]MDW8190708.1 phosphatidylserine/phosphatidylglycerophosphate/cardiolipin synthase family protein [Pseudobdellovibrionaceae bacterium]